VKYSGKILRFSLEWRPELMLTEKITTITHYSLLIANLKMQKNLFLRFHNTIMLFAANIRKQHKQKKKGLFL
ncbi:MAG: hypothetical protein J5706_07215, partial [Elusimicrobiales bacterium]|nr:hypothetical protein [Elusimicrobiales bacterium]